MPQAVGGFIGWLVTSGMAALTAVGLSEAAAIFVIDIGIKLTGLTLLGNLASKLVNIPDLSATARNNLVTTRGTIEHQRMIYGESLVSGPLWYMNSAGTHNQSLYHAVVVAGHEIDDITDVYLDDTPIPNEYIDWLQDGGVGDVTSGWLRGDTSYQTAAYFYKYLGDDPQAASDQLKAAFTEINTSHMGNGIAYFVARTDYFEGQTAVWSKGHPQAYKALVRGKKVYDPRSDSSQSFGNGPHRVNSSATWEWSDNPALCWADYMIDAKFGLGEGAARIDYGYVASAAAINDTTVYTPVGTDKKFRCNGTLSAANTHKANLQSILSAANMTMAFSQGKWRLRGWEYSTPTLQFSDDDLRGDLQIKLAAGHDQRFNTVRGIFVDKDRLYTPQQFPQVTAAEYIARDNSETIYRDIQLPLTNDPYMAQRLAFGVLEQSDLQTTVIYPSNFKTLPVEIGGTIGLSNEKMGWDGKVFRVTNYKLSDMQGIDLVLQEDFSTSYAEVGTAEYYVSSAAAYAINEQTVPAPNSLWILPRLEGNLIRWNSPPARLFEYVSIYVSPTSAWTDAELLSESRTDYFFHQTDRPRTYYYWARSVNYAGVISDRIPNSEYSNVFAAPALMDGRMNPTFELSTDIDDYFSHSTSSWIDTTGGEGGSHALGMAKIGNASAWAKTNQYIPILSNTMRMTTRYRVNSNYGTWPNSCYLHLATINYRPSGVASYSSKFQKTEPSTYTQVGTNNYVGVYTNSITMNGSWYTLSVDIDLTNAVNSGATVCNPYMAWTSSSAVTIDTSINVRHNRWTMFWI